MALSLFRAVDAEKNPQHEARRRAPPRPRERLRQPGSLPSRPRRRPGPSPPYTSSPAATPNPSGVVTRRPTEVRNGCLVTRYSSRGITDENLHGLDAQRRARRHRGRRP
jgi:hypothetical protein